MKRIAIFAMLAVCALLATPLLTTNAVAVIDEREMTTGADWDYRVYNDGDGNVVIEMYNFGDDIEPARMGGKIALCSSDGNIYCVMFANGDVIGGEWYGGSYPADAVETLGGWADVTPEEGIAWGLTTDGNDDTEPADMGWWGKCNGYTYVAPTDTNPGSLHIILTLGPYYNIEAAGTGNLYEEVVIKPIRLHLA